MRCTTRTLLASGVLALASRVSAQLASRCPSSNVCFKLNIPESTASSGTGDIFFQISAPSSYEWVALGQGKAMSGSNMFVVYTNSGGSNVTLSPRTANGHNMPTYSSSAKVTLLDGSGVSNGVMTANIKCSNCNSWSGGSMDFTSGSGNWIYGYLSSGGPKNSNDQSASIRQHDGNAAFAWDFASAKGGNSVNPLVAAAPSGTGAGTGTATATGGAATASVSCIPRPASAAASASGSVSRAASRSATAANPASTSDDTDNDDSNNNRGWTGRPTFFTAFPTARPTSRPFGDSRLAKRQQLPYCDEISSGGGNSNNNGNSNSGFTPIASGGGNQQTMLIAHGVLASLAFVILFPAGAIAIRLASFPGIIWIHAAFQVFAYLIYIAGFGLGVYLAKDLNLIDHYHPIIGIVVLVLIFFQPILGFLHHTLFKKYNTRTFWSYGHIWLGRIAITLGIVNGGLGLKLADSMNMSSEGGIIAYGVIAGLVWLVWVAAIFFGEKRRKRTIANTPPKYTESPGVQSNRSGRAAVPPPHEYYALKER